MGIPRFKIDISSPSSFSSVFYYSSVYSVGGLNEESYLNNFFLGSSGDGKVGTGEFSAELSAISFSCWSFLLRKSLTRLLTSLTLKIYWHSLNSWANNSLSAEVPVSIGAYRLPLYILFIASETPLVSAKRITLSVSLSIFLNKSPPVGDTASGS